MGYSRNNKNLIIFNFDIPGIIKMNIILMIFPESKEKINIWDIPGINP
jgi:hypothetical protein